MPNHCANTLSVTGSQEILDQFRAYAPGIWHGQQSALELNQFVPMPEPLVDTHSPSTESLEKQQALIEQYGACDWYNWAKKNWGTKWGCYNVEVEAHPGELLYRFDSAWTPFSASVLTAMSLRFPGLAFEHRYAEQGSGYWGVRTASDGTIYSDAVYHEVRTVYVNVEGEEIDPDTITAKTDYEVIYPDVPDDIAVLLSSSG